jgi:hypothetical protein
MFEVTKARTAVGVLVAAAVAAPGAGAMPTEAGPSATAGATAGVTDASGGYTFEAAPSPPAATRIVEVRSGGGFDWGDAGLGAAGMLSLLGLGAGAVVVARRGRPTMG